MPCERKIITATDSDADRLTDTFLLGFAAEPLGRRLFPDGHTYLEAMTKVFRSFGGRATLEAGTMRTMDDYSGYVTWLPPGSHIDEEGLGAIIAEHVPPADQADVEAVFNQMAEFHPHEPQWYLPIIVVDPAYHGQGIGSRLMEDGLALCDQRGLVSYLEATSPRSARLYEHFGYRVLSEIQVGSSPPVFPMRREALASV